MKKLSGYSYLTIACLVALLWIASSVDWATVTASTSGTLARLRGTKSPAPGSLGLAPSNSKPSVQTRLDIHYSGELIQGRDGYAYGAATTIEDRQNSGATTQWGAILRFSASGEINILHSFNRQDGAFPSGTLIEARDGFLYGVTTEGGATGSGTIFRLRADGSDFSTVYHFKGAGEGANPIAGLIEDQSGTGGRLYGTTSRGGQKNRGTIYQVSASGELKVLHAFAENEGAYPSSGLLSSSDGYLYGTTRQGGRGDRGTIFKLRLDGSEFQTVHEFKQKEGAALDAHLIENADGWLYGVAAAGGVENQGTLFRLAKDGSAFEVLHKFGQAPESIAAHDGSQTLDGVHPLMVKASANGFLYGTTSEGGVNGRGVVFRVAPDGSSYEVIYGFGDGDDPRAGLVAATDGRIYLPAGFLGAAREIGAGPAGNQSAEAGSVSIQTTLTVSNLNDSGGGSLRDAINNAAAGDTINIVATGTLTLTTGQLVIGKNLTITGPGSASLTVSGGNGTSRSRVFLILPGTPSSAGPTVAISGMTIANGLAKGGDGGCGGSGGGGAGGVGGGMFVGKGSTVTLRNLVFLNNRAVGGNGGSGNGCGNGYSGGGGGGGLGMTGGVGSGGANGPSEGGNGGDGGALGSPGIGGGGCGGNGSIGGGVGAGGGGGAAGPSGLCGGGIGANKFFAGGGGGGGAVVPGLGGYSTFGGGGGGGGILPNALNGDIQPGLGGGGAGKGGNGARCIQCGGGGGGGAAAGAGLFVWSEFALANSQTRINLVNCSFTGNTVQAGTGGSGGGGVRNGGNGFTRGADAYFMESETLSECSTSFGDSYFEHNFFINHLPAPNAGISGPNQVCPSTSYTSSTSDEGPGATYAWTIFNGTITGGQGTRTVTYTTGTFSVAGFTALSLTVAGSNGCTQSDVSYFIFASPVVISTPTSICPNSGGHIASVPSAGAGASYTWTISNGSITGGQGTQQVTFSSGAPGSTTLNVSVLAAGSPCALTGSITISASNSVSPVDGTISVNTTACPNSTGLSAFVPDAGPGATYFWSISGGTITAGQGTRQITFSIGSDPNVTFSVTIGTASGCGTTTTRNVSFSAVVPPVVTCPPGQVLYQADLGTNGAIVNYPIPAAADFCGGVSVVCTPPPGSFFPMGSLNGPNFGLGGPTVVTCIARDTFGTVRACAFQLGVTHISPTITQFPANDTITVNADPGHCQALVDLSQYIAAQGAPQPVLKYKFNPAPGQPTFTSTAANPTPFAIGTTALYVFPTNGVTLAPQPRLFRVIVVDSTPPTINCPANITVDSAVGSCSAIVNFTVTGTDTNCPNVTIVSEPPSGSSFTVGSTVVTSTATDSAGNHTSCSFTVRVVDRTPPGIVCPASITVPNAPGSCSSVVNFNVLANDDCSTVTVVSNPPSGSTFPLGTTTVTSTATDEAGNIRTCTFPVTVTDASAPGISCPGDITKSADPGLCAAVVNYAATASDLCSNPTLVCTPPSGAAFAKGVTQVSCTATDGSGNTTNCGFNITVTDNEAPKSCVTPPAGMVSWWSGDGNANDLQGNNNGSLENSATATGAGKVGQAFSFNGVDGFVTVANHASLNGFSAATLDAWVKLNSVNGRQAIVSKAPQAEYYLLVNNGRLSFENNNTGSGAFTGATQLSSNVWYHVAVTYDGSNSRLYVNGVEDGIYPGAWSSANSQPLSIGQRGDNADYFNGSIDEVEIFNRALSVGEIQTIYNAGSFGKCKPVLANAAAGQCSTVVNYSAPSFSDNCTTATVTCLPVSGSVFLKGVTTVNCTVTDAAGNSFDNAFAVRVNDGEPPVLSCPSPLIVSTDNGQCSAVVNYTPPTATDNCSTVTTVCVPQPGSAFPKGVTSVTCTATDGMSNKTSCTFSITVNDTQNPTIICPSNISIVSNTCVTNAYSAPVGNDNCPGVSVVCSPPTTTCFASGTTTTVTCTATDTSNNTANCGFTVTIVPCTISCPINQTKSNDAGKCGAVVNYPAPTTTGSCGNVICSPAAGSFFPKGTTTVTCTSQIGPTCSFTVTVNDTEVPALVRPANITKGTDANQCSAVITYSTPSASDNCAGVGAVSCNPASGTTFQKGTATVTCNVDDASGNHGSCTFTVTVNDTQLPALTCPANIARATDPNQCSAVVIYAVPTASDNCPGVGSVSCSPGSGAAFPKGTTTVRCSATDTSGNIGSCSFVVTVNDTQPPSIICPANLTKGTDPNLCSAVVIYTAPVVSDNCPGVGAPVCTPPSGTSFPKGVSTVACTVRDASLNASSCGFSVTVNDTQPPAITCPVNQTRVLAAPTDVTVVVSYPAPVVVDNCPGATLACSPPSGSAFPVGVTTVACTATDAANNKTSCNFTVTVFDVCLQDDGIPATVVLFNSFTGDYLFCCSGTTYSGRGTVQKHGSTYTLTHNLGDRRVTANLEGAMNRGSASLQSPVGTTRGAITDRDIRNNSCSCH